MGLTTIFLLLSYSCEFADVGRSLTRGRVCRLQLLLALASTFILGSDSRGIRDHILLSQIRRLLRLSLYSLRTDHAQKTQIYCCLAPTAQETTHVVPTQRVYWRSDCCLETNYKHSSYCDTAFIVPCFNVFNKSLPSNALIQFVILLLRACVEVSVVQHFSHGVNTPYYVSVASHLPFQICLNYCGIGPSEWDSIIL
jgi:hypothetical protein